MGKQFQLKEEFDIRDVSPYNHFKHLMNESLVHEHLSNIKNNQITASFNLLKF